ncbi:hypothetical protein [Mycolicibacterium peregrinum]|uniref:hypothetical protein n=1 Tax=Mycolicibacterium peregrinum TaxID=43304 RepID=UPI000A665B20|nr:hypothetical protein [Mycolicibacterium peregrinum]
MDRQKLADEWDDGISPAVAGLAGLAEPYGVALDYSAQSLRALEHVITTLFHEPDDLFTDDDRPVVRALIAYVGLTLTHLTTGHWDWDNQPGFAGHAQPTLTDTALRDRITTTYWGWDDNPAGIPIAVPADGLELQPVSPLHLLFATVIDRPTNAGPLGSRPSPPGAKRSPPHPRPASSASTYYPAQNPHPSSTTGWPPANATSHNGPPATPETGTSPPNPSTASPTSSTTTPPPSKPSTTPPTPTYSQAPAGTSAKCCAAADPPAGPTSTTRGSPETPPSSNIGCKPTTTETP